MIWEELEVQLQGVPLRRRIRAGHLVMMKTKMKRTGLRIFSPVKVELRCLWTLAVLLLGGFSWAKTPGPNPGHPTLLSPHSDPIAFHAGQVFVVNTPADTLDVIDAATARVTARIPTGIDPVSVRVRPDGREIWVSNHLSDSVSVIDNDPESPTYLSVVATIQDIDLEKKSTRFDEPVGIAFANNEKAYVALSSTNRIAVIDVASRKATRYLRIPAQEPRAMEVRGGRLYVTPFESNNQTQLSGGKPGDLDGKLVTFDARKLAGAFDSVGFTVDVVKQPKIPDRDLFIFDTRTDKLVSTVETLGTSLFGLTVDAAGNIYVANTDARNHINGKAGTAKHGLKELDNRPYLNRVTKVSAGGEVDFFQLNPLPPQQPNRKEAVATPFAVKASRDGDVLFLTSAGSDVLLALSVKTGEVVAKAKVGSVPRGVALEEDAGGKPVRAWVMNAVSNSVSKVAIAGNSALQVEQTIELHDPTPPVYKEGRMAFNTARASSNGTFSCASCHADGHTDHLLWVLDTPHLVGADQIEPRLSQTLRGLRGTAPYHWDGVPGDPYGGRNAASRKHLPPNADINKPESAVRHVIDGSMATTMFAHGSEVTNDEEKPGYLTARERDAMAVFLLNLSHMPTRGRAYSDRLSEKALTGFERFHVTGARDRKNLNTSVCGSCHTLPYLATDQESMNVPSFRGALDRFITQAQGRNSVIDLEGVQEVAEDGFPEEEVWKRMLNMGEHGRLWPVIDMFKESSMGFSGAFARQVTLSAETSGHVLTQDIVSALERSAREGSVVLEVNGCFHGSEGTRRVKFYFAEGAYHTVGGGPVLSRKELFELAMAESFTGTFTGYHGEDVISPPPALWTAGVLHKQRGAQLFPRINEKQRSMTISALYLRDGASLLVDGKKVQGTIQAAGKDLVEIRLERLPEKGLRMLQVQNPGSYLSNEFIFFVESADEAVERYQKEPDYHLTTVLNSALINNHPAEARILIDAGADLNMPHEHFDKERPPLIIAAHYGRTVMVKELLRRGADPNIRTKNGDTALHRAAHMGRLEICIMLLRAGADPSLVDNNGKRPVNLIGHFNRPGHFEKYHAPYNVNLTLDHRRYLRESPAVRKVLESSASKKRPNVVLLLADDLGSKDIGCYGGPVHTPALDKLAARGVRFRNFHAGAPVCSPSRATFLTGRQHLRTGVYHVIQDHEHDMHLLEREVTIAELLKSNGYQTVHLGKWHVGAPFRGRDKPSLNDHGFDYWLATDNNASPSHRNPSNFYRNGKRVGELEGYACQILADEAITWLEKERNKEAPFFLNIWFQEPHDPIAAPDEIVARYGALDDPAAIYSATIENTDRAIARLVAKLEELGELNNTLIVYTSDHGSYREDRNGGLRGNKGSQFQGGLLTPGIFFWPDGFDGQRLEDQPAGSVDLLPTLCGLLQVARPRGVHLDGSDLSPLLTKSGKFERSQPLFWSWPTGQPSASLRKGKYTLMGYRAEEYRSKKDRETIERLVKRLHPLVEKEMKRKIERRELFSLIFNSSFKTQSTEALRRQFVHLNGFQESWSGAIKEKAGVFRKFELYDLEGDPRQLTDIATREPEVTERLKRELLRINASVLADAPIWGKEAVERENEEETLEQLLVRLNTHDLPAAYKVAVHQDYVDRRIEEMKPTQRPLVGALWKEQRRLHPNMKNRGHSFIRILEYVARGGVMPSK